MLLNDLKMSWRGLRKRRLHATLNVLGLSIGLACCLLIGLYVHHAWRYDRFHENADRLYRMIQVRDMNVLQRLASVGGWVGPAVAEQVPGVETAVRVGAYRVTVRQPEAAFFQQPMVVADPAFLTAFSFPLIRGEAATALAEPFTMVLTATAATRYFGTADPIGQTVAIEAPGFTATYTVTGLIGDVPAHSHLHFDVVVSAATITAFQPDAFDRGMRLATYLLLAPDADAGRVGAQIEPVVAARFERAQLDEIDYTLQPLTDIHLRSQDIVGIHDAGSAGVVSILVLIAVFILLLAGVNFVNLSTARAGERAREVGVRKALGAPRSTLARQFLTESLLLTTLAGVGALVLMLAALPAFSSLSGQPFTAASVLRGGVLLALLGVGLLVGLLAGLYPALVLSRFDPARVLKGGPGGSGHGARFRQALVVFQFAVTIVLGVATGIAFQQLDYLREKDLGYDRAHVVSVNVPAGPAALERLRTAWAALPGVTDLTADSRRSATGSSVRMIGKGADTTFMEIRYFHVADNYVDALDITLLAGRTFSPALASDSAGAVLINPAAVAVLDLGTAQEAVGQTLQFFRTRWTVIGVVDDFIHGSLHQPVAPLFMAWQPASLRRLLVRLHPDRQAETLAALEAAWQQHIPDHPFAYTYLDEALARLYDDERRLGRLFGLFALLALLVATLGLFGLTAFATTQRTKEVGVRKVLGASPGGIVALFLKEFVVLVVLAFVVAAPLAFTGMSRWLETFAFRIDIGPAAFAAAGLIALTIAILTVGLHALRAALQNPADALRHE